MSKHRPFLLSDFSLRNAMAGIVAYLIVSAICVLAGLTVESLPPFRRVSD